MDGKEKILDADRATIIDAYKIEIAAFDKRLNTYLKRYGMTKVNTLELLARRLTTHTPTPAAYPGRYERGMT